MTPIERLDAVEKELVAFVNGLAKEQLVVALLATGYVGERPRVTWTTRSEAELVYSRAVWLEDYLAWLRRKVPPFIPDAE